MIEKLETFHQRSRLFLMELSSSLARAFRNDDSKHAQTAQFVALEDRVLLSASPLGELENVVPAGETGNEVEAFHHADSELELAASEQNKKELVFVDKGVKNHEQLLNDLLREVGSGRQLEIVFLDQNQNGINQISETLSSYTDLSAIHLLSHGSDGQVKLGSTWLNFENLGNYSNEISNWNFALNAEADLLIYGCNLAATDDGQALTEALGELCNCDVAASVDDTGNISRGGDWDLEFVIGSIETETVFSVDVQQDWYGLLAVETLRDEFNSASFSNNDGSVAWSNDWQEIGESNGIFAGNVQISTVFGEQGIQFWQDNRGAMREADLSSATSATLTFDYARFGLDDSDDFIVVEVSSDGGGVWYELERFEGPANDVALQSASYDISAYVSINTQIRFVTSGMNATESLFVDNVQIEYDDAVTPGGVETGLNLWLRAGEGVTTSGSNVIQWDNQVATSLLTEVTGSGGTRPVLNTSVLNFNDVISFDGTDDQLSASTVLGSTLFSPNASSIYTVTSLDSTGNVILQWQDDALGNSNRVNIEDELRFDYGDLTGDQYLAPSPTDGYHILNAVATPADLSFNIDGQQTAPQLASGNPLDVSNTGNFTLGNYDLGGYADNIDLGEVIIFGATLSAGEQAQVDSYLAVKYGITLDQTVATHYVDSQGNIIWNANDNATYNNDIAGIGRDLSSALEQSQSSSINSDSIVTMSAASDQHNREFLIWGNDDGALAEVTGESTSVASRLDRIWHVEETGDVGTTTIEFDLTGLSYTGSSASDFHLIVDTDADFSVGASLVAATSYNSGSEIVSFTVNLADADFFALSTEFGGNTAATASNLTQIQSYVEGAASVALNNIVVTDGDAGDTITARLTVNDTATGLLTTGTFGAVTSTYNSGSGIWEAIGNVTDVNAALADVEFSPTSNNDIDTTITTHIEDALGLGPSDGTITLDVTPQNDAPMATNMNQTQGYTEGAASVALDDIVVSDVDTSPTQTITAELTLNNTATGALSIGTFGSVTSTYNSGTGLWQAIGSITDVNSALAAVAFIPTTNNDVDTTITTHIEDQDFDGPADGTINLNVSAQNDDPANSGGIPANLVVEQDVATNIDLSLIDLDDVDANGFDLTVTLSTASGGILSALSGGGVIVVGSGTGSITLTGDLANLNAYIDDATKIQYTGPTGVEGNDADSITVAVSDNGSTGAGGGGNVNLGVVNVDIAAPAVLWLSTDGSATDNDVAPVSWNDDEIVSFNQQNMTLGTSTDGTFAIEHTLAGNIRAMHYVTNATAVETGGGPVYNLLPGQIVLSFRNSVALTAPGPSILNVDNKDVVVYTPWLGTYELLLNNAFSGNDIHAISIVEKQTTIGVDTVLNAGTYLIAQSSGGLLDDVYTYVGSTALETPTLLLEGSDAEFGMGGTEIQGLELLEDAVTIGGQSLASGTLLITVDNNVTLNGAVLVDEQDVVALTINATQQDSVPDTDISASILFDGSDVGLTAGSEKLNALTLIESTTGDSNTAPTITSDGGGATAAINVAENTTAVTTVTATDPDLPADTLTYTITGGADSGDFAINSSTGVLTLVAGKDFETFTDTDLDGVYEVEVTVDDGTGRSDVQSISVTITDGNETPTITSDGGGATAAINVAENTTAVTTVTATDPDLPADTLTYTISGGADSGDFAINSSTGVLTLVSGKDFEAFADADLDGVYEVEVTVDDGNGLDDVQSISVTITDSNETPTITSDGGGATAAINVAENTTAVTTVTATDPDLPADTLTYTISGGADSGDFAINSSTGVLTLVSGKDFEAFADADLDGVYEVEVTVDDGNGLDDVQSISVTITDSNEAPTITSDGGGATGTINVAENTTAVTTVTATDPDLPADTLTYTITGGADLGDFAINSSSGVLTLVSGKDFETFTDANLDGVYEVEVTVDDGNGLSDVQSISVAITDTNETPTITSDGGGATAAINVAENTTAVTTVTATDPDLPANTLTYAISGGADLGDFAINSSTGVLTLVSGKDFETFTDADLDGVYEVEITVDDGNGLSDVQTISVTITDGNETPTITSDGGGATTAINVVENTTAVTTVTATDPDLPADTLTFTISGGADLGDFAINSSTGVLTLVSGKDFETFTDADLDGVYEVEITVDDGNGLSDVQTINVTVADVNEAPSVSLTNLNVNLDENISTASAIRVADIVIDDDALGSETLSLNGRDRASFEIVGNELRLRAGASLDFEVQSSYDVTVNVDDSSLAGSPDAFVSQTINVRDVNESPNVIGINRINTTEDARPLVFDLSNWFEDQDSADSSLDISVNSVSVSWLNAVVDPRTNRLSVWSDPNEWGSGILTLTATDRSGLTVLKSVVVNVAPENDTVSVKNQKLTGLADTTLLGKLLESKTDVDGEALTVVITRMPKNGVLVVLPDGSFSFTPDADFEGTTSFQFRLDDGVKLSKLATVKLTILPVATAIEDEPIDSEPVDEEEASIEPEIVVDPDLTVIGDTGPEDENNNIVNLEPDSQPAKENDGVQFVDQKVDEDNFVITQPIQLLARTNQFDTSVSSIQSNTSYYSSTMISSAMTVMSQPGALWNELDTFRQAAASASTFGTMAIGSVGTVSSGLIVGYVIWAVRSGLLLSSLVAAMPAWNLLDPLAIISIADAGESDSESLEEIVEAQKRKINN